jgi:RRXRR protein
VAVFVLDERNKPLLPCSEKRARRLLRRGRAVTHRRHPSTIRLKDRVGGDVGPVRLKIDPGSKTTGIAPIADADGNKPAKVRCLFALPRWALSAAVADTGLPVEASSGGRTKSNRARLWGCENPCARRRLCWRGRDARRPADSVTGNNGERKRGLLPHEAYGIRFPTRLLHTHQIRRRLSDRRPAAGRSAQRQAGRDPRRARRGSCQRLFESGQCRRNQRQIL